MYFNNSLSVWNSYLNGYSVKSKYIIPYIKPKVTIWSPPLSEETILNNLSDYSNEDLRMILYYQKHLSDEFIEKIKMIRDLSI